MNEKALYDSICRQVEQIENQAAELTNKKYNLRGQIVIRRLNDHRWHISVRNKSKLGSFKVNLRYSNIDFTTYHPRLVQQGFDPAEVTEWFVENGVVCCWFRHGFMPFIAGQLQEYSPALYFDGDRYIGRFLFELRDYAVKRLFKVEFDSQLEALEIQHKTAIAQRRRLRNKLRRSGDIASRV